MKGIRHTGIYVRNLEAMVSFYKELFQLQVVVHQRKTARIQNACLMKQTWRLKSVSWNLKIIPSLN